MLSILLGDALFHSGAQEEGPHHIQKPNILQLPRLRDHESNKLLFFINYQVLGIAL